MIKRSFKFRLVLILALLTSLTSGTSLYYFYHRNYDTVWELMRQRLHDIAHTGYYVLEEKHREAIKRLSIELDKASLTIRKEDLKKVEPGHIYGTLTPEDIERIQSSSDFQLLVQALRRIKTGTSSDLQPLQYIRQLPPDPNNPPQLRFAYILVRTKESIDGKFLKFIADSDFEEIDRNQNGEIDEDEQSTPVGSIYNVSEQYHFEQAFRGNIVVNKDYVEDRWGMWLTTTIPILDQDGSIIAVLGLDLDAKGIYNNLQNLKIILFIVLVGMLLLTIFTSITLANFISKPIVLLKDAAEEVRRGNMSVNIKINSNDEIGQLGSAFNLMIKNINSSIQEIKLQKDAFYRFVPEEFLKILERDSATDINLGDKIIDDMTILFSDIRSFTTISETIPPEEVYEFLNEYFQLISPLIVAGGGFIDKYMGDGIMAIFANRTNKKDSADSSIHTSISLIKELEKYNQKRMLKGKEPIRIGIGINTGELIIGTVGTKDRLSTTVVGNTVNLASRLESITLKYSTEIIVSASTIATLKDHSLVRYREIDTIIAKGMTSPCEIYEVYNHKDLDFLQKMSYSLKPYMDGLVAYKLGLFEEAKTNFQEALNLNPQDTISKLYLERVYLLLDHPPGSDWDGVIKFDIK